MPTRALQTKAESQEQAVHALA